MTETLSADDSLQRSALVSTRAENLVLCGSDLFGRLLRRSAYVVGAAQRVCGRRIGQGGGLTGCNDWLTNAVPGVAGCKRGCELHKVARAREGLPREGYSGGGAGNAHDVKWVGRWVGWVVTGLDFRCIEKAVAIAVQGDAHARTF